MFPVAVPEHFRIIAHRGASGYAPENTRAAFQLAKDMGAAEVELDVQLTTDGVPVLCHDKTLLRYGHGDAAVEGLSLKQLKELDMGAWFSPYLYGGEAMLTLSELLTEFRGDFVFHVELKGQAENLVSKTVGVIAEQDMFADCIFTSFRWQSLQELKKQKPEARCGYLTRQVNADVLRAAEELTLFQVCPHSQNVNEEIMVQLQGVCAEVRVYGVSGTPLEVAATIRRTADLGCSGMTINWPDWAVGAG